MHPRILLATLATRTLLTHGQLVEHQPHQLVVHQSPPVRCDIWDWGHLQCDWQSWVPPSAEMPLSAMPVGSEGFLEGSDILCRWKENKSVNYINTATTAFRQMLLNSRSYKFCCSASRVPPKLRRGLLTQVEMPLCVSKNKSPPPPDPASNHPP